MSFNGARWVYDRAKTDYERDRIFKKQPISNSIGGVRRITKGRLGNVTFQVNPTTMTYSGGMNWTEVPSAGADVPLMQLGCGKSNSLSFELYINEWMFGQKVNADAFTMEIMKCRSSRTPVKFVYGNMVSDVVVTDCEIVGQSYNPDLSLREVTMSVSITAIY